MSKATQEIQFQKLFIQIIALEGGLGKSQLAKAIVHFFEEQAVSLYLTDMDDTNRRLFNLYKSERANSNIIVEVVKLLEPEQREKVLTCLQNDAQVVVQDWPSSSDEVLKSWGDAKSIPEVAKAFGYKHYVFIPITEKETSLNAVKALYALYGDSVHYVFAMVNRQTSTMKLLEVEQQLKEMDEYSFIENKNIIHVPNANDKSLDKLVAANVKFSAIKGMKDFPSSVINVADALNIQRFKSEIAQQIKPILLG